MSDSMSLVSSDSEYWLGGGGAGAGGFLAFERLFLERVLESGFQVCGLSLSSKACGSAASVDSDGNKSCLPPKVSKLQAF
jgi:hypothetical protein